MKHSIFNAALASALRNGVLLVIPLCVASTSTADTHTDRHITDTGAAHRIDASGKLRMLSQRVVAASCYVQAGIDSEATTAQLTAAMAEFSLITAGLEFGDPDLGMQGAETDVKILATIERLLDIWDPINTAVENVIAGTATQEDITQMALRSEPLLEMAQSLVAAVTAEYSLGAAMVMRDALAIDIAGRQRMLAQRMSKDVCLFATGIDAEHALEDLSKTAKTFGTSLSALQGGMPSAGILPPTNERVIEDLNVAAADWEIVETKIADALAGNSISPERLSEMFRLANTLTADMNKVVIDYTADSGEDS